MGLETSDAAGRRFTRRFMARRIGMCVSSDIGSAGNGGGARVPGMVIDRFHLARCVWGGVILPYSRKRGRKIGRHGSGVLGSRVTGTLCFAEAVGGGVPAPSCGHGDAAPVSDGGVPRTLCSWEGDDHVVAGATSGALRGDADALARRENSASSPGMASSRRPEGACCWFYKY